MKRTIFTSLVMAFISFYGFNQKTETTEFIVYGNCGMCERTIEGALDKKDGVSDADWNQESHLMKVTYDSSKISLDEIKEKIAKKGYDTDSHRALDKTYNALPGCCKYERPENNNK